MSFTSSRFHQKEYDAGFVTKVDTDEFPVGLSEEVIALISEKKEEPAFMLDLRMKAYRYWQKQVEPQWADLDIEPIDFQGVRYYAVPKNMDTAPKSLEEVDAEILKTFEKLGIPLSEQKRLTGVAVDAVFDSVSVGTCLLYTSPSPRDRQKSRMPSSA